MTGSPHRRLLDVGDATVDVASWGSGDPKILLLHDGLGSIDQFGDLPADLADATKLTVLAYDRPGHGISTPVPNSAWSADWLEGQADLLAALFCALGVEQPLLVGHSDGGSIALLHAAAAPNSVRGIVALAAHSFVEDVCVNSIAGMRADRSRWIAGLSRFHSHPAEVFDAWSGVWTGPDFRPWDMRDRLGSISAHTLVVQGCDDEYATDAMATSTAAAVGANAQCVMLPGAGHLLPQQVPDKVIELVLTLLT